MNDLSAHRILLVNDDGIDAPGMKLLERLVRQITDDVWVVAPEDNRSGASHSISTHAPMRVSRRDERHFAVRGTPTECTMLAVYELIEGRRPTICISGINKGPNLAEDAAYSGTIAAAREACQLGIPSIALSQVFASSETSYRVGSNREIPWETSERWCLDVLRHLLAQELPSGMFLNVNLPGVSPGEVRGMRITTQGQRPPGCYVPEKRVDGFGQPYYWIMLSYEEGDSHPDSDLKAISDNYISITPMKLDMTDLVFREDLIGKLANSPRVMAEQQ